VEETLLYDDHDVRLLWQVQGRNVYVEPPPDRELLTRLVRLTQVIPAPAHSARTGLP